MGGVRDGRGGDKRGQGGKMTKGDKKVIKKGDKR